MSTLNHFLIRDAVRGKIRTEGKPGQKVPALLKTSFDSELEEFIVSDSSGDLKVVSNRKDGVCSAFFPLDPDAEDAYLAILMDQLFQLQCAQSWGNVVLLDSIQSSDVQDYNDFFEHYDLQFAQVLTGPLGYASMVESQVMKHPGGQGNLTAMPTEETLSEWTQEYLMEGQVLYRPVKYNALLGPYVAFCSPASMVGSYTRIGSHISVTLHNADRGLVLVRLTEGDLDGDVVGAD